MTMHMKRAMLRVTHANVLMTMFVLAGIMQTIVLTVAGLRGEQVSAFNAYDAALTGGGVVWSYLNYTGRLRGGTRSSKA